MPAKKKSAKKKTSKKVVKKTKAVKSPTSNKKIGSLTAHEMNPRKISASQQRILYKNLKEYGDLSGITWNRRNKKLVGGHQRFSWFSENDEVEVIHKFDKPQKDGTCLIGLVERNGQKFFYREVSLDDRQHKAAMIAANKAGGEWDLGGLKELLTDLDSGAFDFELAGFGLTELEDLITRDSGEDDDSAKIDIEDSDTPEVAAKALTKPGELWILGSHRLLSGDSTKQEDVDRLLDGEAIDMVFTDPPYGIQESAAKRKSRETNSLAKSNSHLTEFIDDSVDYAIKAFEICRKLGIKTQIWFGANYYCHSLPQTNNWLVWDKRVEDKQKDNNSDCELAWVKSGANSVRIFRHLWKGLIKGSEHGQKRVHPTQRPVALPEWCFENYGNPDTVLDLFGGSGSTLIACEKTERACYVMELEPVYVDVIIKRWMEFTGEEAMREDGLTWSELVESSKKS